MDGQIDGLMDRGMDRDKLIDGYKRRSLVKDVGKFIGKVFF